MTVNVLQVIGGIALLAGGGEALVRGASDLAARLGVRPAVIGLTVVAVGTSMPELVVSLMAALQGRADLAVANVVGSNLFNVGVILAIAALFQPLAVHLSALRSEGPMLLGVTAFTLVVGRDGEIDRVEGGLLVLALTLFTAWLVRAALEDGSNPEDASAGAKPPTSLVISTLWIGLGLALLAGGAHILVEGAVELARSFGWTERVIGLTIVAAGTSMPELAATVSAARKGAVDMALANVLGSNIFNLAGILGLVAVIVPQRVAPEVIGFDGWWLIAFTLALFPIMLSHGTISRLEGALLLVAYAIYLTLLLI